MTVSLQVTPSRRSSPCGGDIAPPYEGGVICRGCPLRLACALDGLRPTGSTPPGVLDRPHGETDRRPEEQAFLRGTGSGGVVR